VDDITHLAMSARDGDRAALERFIRTSMPDVWRLCAYLSSPDRADDLTQDTFVRVIGALPAFRGESSARTWILSIARRACADDIRRVQRRRGLLLRLSALRAADRTEADHPAEVDDLVHRLDPDRRDAFVLTQLIGLSYEETASVCGCPVGTIRSRVSRARADLLAAAAEPAGGRPEGDATGESH
jgi:RNA polymerase sigma-70 factor (ECF subfamily)